ncbi:hypothetical protein Scep_001275 [Stephania cephalantha]|uniref:Uncharacterized protein n=1 Tax=Stephania cephalantha TaxID=152367 RepID=A0AAP0LBG3_9MAGN
MTNGPIQGLVASGASPLSRLDSGFMDELFQVVDNIAGPKGWASITPKGPCRIGRRPNMIEEASDPYFHEAARGVHDLEADGDEWQEEYVEEIGARSIEANPNSNSEEVLEPGIEVVRRLFDSIDAHEDEDQILDLQQPINTETKHGELPQQMELVETTTEALDVVPLAMDCEFMNSCGKNKVAGEGELLEKNKISKNLVDTGDQLATKDSKWTWTSLITGEKENDKIEGERDREERERSDGGKGQSDGGSRRASTAARGPPSEPSQRSGVEAADGQRGTASARLAAAAIGPTDRRRCGGSDGGRCGSRRGERTAGSARAPADAGNGSLRNADTWRDNGRIGSGDEPAATRRDATRRNSPAATPKRARRRVVDRTTTKVIMHIHGVPSERSEPNRELNSAREHIRSNVW